ncbi:MAG: rhodanese-like domain-containing protein [Chromatiales bacterium]|nr:rhodanese-like domain-containing protein [Chromatiales bacterium]
MKTIAKICTAALFMFASAATIAAEAPMSVDGTTYVDAAQAKALFDQGAAFVDPRRNSEFEAGRIPDAIHLELKSAFNEAALADNVQKDEPVVFYCNGAKCPRSAKCSEMALNWGYSKVYYFRDGFPAWKAAGYPVE